MPAALPAPRVRVIVVNYNGGAWLAHCLENLQRQSLTAFEAVVVDNGSTDGSLAGVPADPRFQVMAMERNLGFAAANNVGAVGARTRWLAALNPDAFPEPDWLERLVTVAEAHPGCVMAGSTQLLDADPGLYDGTGDNLLFLGFAWRGHYLKPVSGPPHPSGEAFAPCAAAALYDRAAFEAVGGFDEYFFCYAEDVDLAFRLRLMGGRCLQVGEAVVRHVSSGIVGRGSPFAAYHGFRNQVWMLVKNLPAPLLAILPFHLALAVLMAAIWLARRDIGRSLAVLRGLRDGLAGLGPVWHRRRVVQATRRVSTADIARALSWSLADRLARRTS
ncbi:MAG: glycosyltransferase family 2 protein, partial [Rhodospirillales bacterium]|nr:glycosyltransferase family 2 protein [Rhodospirillales bacterium]